MRSKIALATFLSLLALSALVLGLGWLDAYGGGAGQTLRFQLHIWLGAITAAILLTQIVLRFAVPPPAFPERWTKGRKFVAGASELLVYVSLLVVVASGALRIVFSGAPLNLFGFSLAPLSISGQPLADLTGPAGAAALRALGLSETTAQEAFVATHQLFAFILAGSIAAHLLVGGPARFWQSEPALGLTASTSAGMPRTLGLSSRLRLLGWLQFWVQLAIALATAILLQFATSGRAFSPSVSGYGDAINWAFYAFLLLWAAVALAFFYTRAARTVVRSYYFTSARATAFWYLSLGLLVGLAGTFISFIGVSLSISLLVAKTVSQPPGIAITDPNKIIRALDVFVLLVNFALLLAHFVGTGIAAWLAAEASRTRYRFAVSAAPQESRA
jgi:cytochrome b561